MIFKSIPIISFELKKTPKEKNLPGYPPFTRANRVLGNLLIRIPIQTESKVDSYLKISFLHIENILPTLQQISQNQKERNAVVAHLDFSNTLDTISFIRAVRKSWAYLNSQKETQPLEIWAFFPEAYHQTLLPLLCCEIDGIVSNHLTNDDVEDFIRDTQLLKTIDPWGGSDYVENQTEYYFQKIIKKK